MADGRNRAWIARAWLTRNFRLRAKFLRPRSSSLQRFLQSSTLSDFNLVVSYGPTDCYLERGRAQVAESKTALMPSRHFEEACNFSTPKYSKKERS